MHWRALIATVLAAASIAAGGCSDEPAPSSQPPASAPGSSTQTPALTPSHGHDAPPVGSTGEAPARKPYDGPLPPLPQPGFDLPRSPEVVRATYEFAARRPDVLQYVPCFCGCERNGHVGNDDCFVSSRDASGRPTWDAHGMG